MDIGSLGSAASIAQRTAEFRQPSPQPVNSSEPTAAVAPAQSSDPVQKSGQTSSEGDLKQAVQDINKTMKALNQTLEFSVDSDSNRMIVKVVDQQTNEVIRQMPSVEALEIAKALDRLQGLLIKQKA